MFYQSAVVALPPPLNVTRTVSGRLPQERSVHLRHPLGFALGATSHRIPKTSRHYQSVDGYMVFSVLRACVKSKLLVDKRWCWFCMLSQQTSFLHISTALIVMRGFARRTPQSGAVERVCSRSTAKAIGNLLPLSAHRMTARIRRSALERS